jgi:hypothetical protein
MSYQPIVYRPAADTSSLFLEKSLFLENFHLFLVKNYF